MRGGLKVFSPISHTHPIAEAGGLPLGFEFWEAFDRAYLAHSHKIVVLREEGWSTSRGVTAEIRIAGEMGIPVELMDPAPVQLGEGEPLDVIAGLLAIIDEWRDETEGKRPSPSASCFECTSGTVPNHLNKGPCAEHRARALLERRGGPLPSESK